MNQAGFGFDDGGPDLERLREFDADFTPTPVVRQVLLHLRDEMGLRPRTMLDPCAGGGVFGMVAREVWPHCLRVAIEPREEELDNLLNHYDFVRRGGVESLETEHVVGWTEGIGFDLIVTNPAFSLWPGIVDDLVPNLSRFGHLVLLGLCDVLLRGEAGLEVATRRPPSNELPIPGAIGFRGPGINPKNGKPWGTDQRSYSWWDWRKHDGLQPCWLRDPLPRLPSADRRWTVKPGTENGVA